MAYCLDFSSSAREQRIHLELPASFSDRRLFCNNCFRENILATLVSCSLLVFTQGERYLNLSCTARSGWYLNDTELKPSFHNTLTVTKVMDRKTCSNP